MTNEDQLTSRLVEHYEQYHDYETHIERHYNHYGDRGIVDLVATEDGTDAIHLYEIKSTAAIEAATGANEIIRQFNRMRRYFFRDESTPMDVGHVQFELCFLPTYECYRHVERNADLYRSAVRSDVDTGLNGLQTHETAAQVTMRPYDKDQVTPAILFSDSVDYRETIDEFGQVNCTMLGQWVSMQYERSSDA